MKFNYVLLFLSLSFFSSHISAVCGPCRFLLIQTASVSSTPNNMVFFNGGSCLAVANTTANQITSYTVSDCKITQTQTISVPTGNANAIAASSNNCIAVASTFLNGISAYSSSGCTLTFENSPSSTLKNPVALTFNPSGSCLISADNGETLSSYTLTDCSLNFLFSQAPLPSVPNALAISTIACNGSTIGAALLPNTPSVEIFTINNSCFFGNPTTINIAGGGGQSIAFSPTLCNGNILLAVDVGTAGIQLFTISTSTCDVMSLGVFPTGSTYSTGFAFTPNGTCLISNNQLVEDTGTISSTDIYSIDPTACTLTLAQSISFGTTTNTQGLAISPTGCLAISAPNINTIYMYSFSPDTLAVSISPSLQALCTNQIITLNASKIGGIAPFTYSWSGPNFSAVTTVPTISIPDPTVSDTGSYMVTVTDSTGCVVTSGTAQVVVNCVNCPCT